ncbi:hypothetical protein ACFLSJ_03585 [Verrucomicrobiota bacterium]
MGVKSICSLLISALCLARAGAVPIENGQLIEGNLTTTGQRDTYTFEAAAGDTVRIRMTRIDVEIAPAVRLLDPNSQLVREVLDVVAADFAETLDMTGTYTIECRDATVFTGRYGLSMVRMPGYPLSAEDEDVGAILNGETIRGQLGIGGDLDAAFFYGSSGATVEVRMVEVDTAVSPHVQLHGPDGALLGEQTDATTSGTTVTLTDSGIHTIVCKDQSDGSGGYDVELTVEGGTLWSGAFDQGGGWKWVDWFGFFNDGSFPWLYHAQHGWMYCTGESVAGLWMYTPDMDWLWTSREAYPFLYRASDNAWLWYLAESANPRWFYNLSAGEWQDL